jgi:hypothetical protein
LEAKNGRKRLKVGDLRGLDFAVDHTRDSALISTDFAPLPENNDPMRAPAPAAVAS